MPNSKPTKEKAAIGQVLFDNKDFEILRLLQKNGRISVKEIADTIHLSTTPVHERVKRLEQTGVIVGYAARLDAALLGKKLMVICHVSLREHNKVAGTKFIKSIIALPEILECYSISGEFDFMLKVLTSDMESYYDFHVNKLFVMGVVKQTHEIL